MPAAPELFEYPSTETCDQEKHHEGDRYKSKVMVPRAPTASPVLLASSACHFLFCASELSNAP